MAKRGLKTGGMWVALLLAVLLLQGCGKSVAHDLAPEEPLKALTVMDTLQMRPALLRAVHDYVAVHKDAEAYVLDCTYYYRDLGMLSNGCNIYNDIFAMMPASTVLFDGGEWSVGDIYPSRYFVVEDKIVFVTSRNDAFLRQEPLEKAYYSVVKKNNEPYYGKVSYLLVEHRKDSVEVLKDLYGKDIVPLREKQVRFDAPSL